MYSVASDQGLQVFSGLSVPKLILDSIFFIFFFSAYAKQLDGMLAKKITELTQLRGIKPVQ